MVAGRIRFGKHRRACARSRCFRCLWAAPVSYNNRHHPIFGVMLLDPVTDRFPCTGDGTR